MDYLRSFVIGTSGAVYIQHLVLLNLKDKDEYSYSYKAYSLVAPIYYGLMSMLALYIGKKFKLTLQERLLVTSIISVIFIFNFSYFYSSKYYLPYKDYDQKKWIEYLINNGGRHLIAFNVVMYLLEKYFYLYPVKVFVIGSSIFSYFITYLKVMMLDRKGFINYKFENFAVAEPFIQGIDLLVSIYFFYKILQFTLINSLILWTIFGSLLWLLLAYFFQTYTYTFTGWLIAFMRVLLTGFIKSVFIYYLLKYL